MTKTPKIIHIITRMDMGGSAQNTLMTCLQLAGSYEIILAFGPSVESRMIAQEQAIVKQRISQFQSRGGRVVLFPDLVRRIDPIRDTVTLVRLWQWIRTEDPDIVHTHSSKAGFLGRWAARMAGVPIVVHTPHGHVFHGHFGVALSRLFLCMERLSDRVTDHLICLTQGELGDYIDLRVTRPEKASVIHSGVDIQQFQQPEAAPVTTRHILDIDDRALVVGTVWLLPIKAPEVLLEAMGHVWRHQTNIVLIYVGKGDLDGPLKAAVRRMRATERVRFLGWRQDVPDVMHAFDIFVLLSRNEGMGRAAVEALAAGLPVIASRTGGLPELVSDGLNGLLVPPRDAKALNRAILELCDDPDLRRRMGEHGRQRAEAFSLQRMVDKLDALYARLLN